MHGLIKSHPVAPPLPCRAQQERAASFPRAGHLHLQTRPDCRPQCRGAAVSCLRLNLVITAIVFWNSTYIADAIARFRATVREAGPRLPLLIPLLCLRDT